MALTIEELADVMNHMELSGAGLRIEIGMLKMDPRLKMYIPLYEEEEAKVRRLIARIKEELGREKADS